MPNLDQIQSGARILGKVSPESKHGPCKEGIFLGWRRLGRANVWVIGEYTSGWLEDWKPEWITSFQNVERYEPTQEVSHD